jgi:tetratricopeptide (TPR) repeat protein
LLASAELHFSRGEWDAATDDFKKVLLLFGEEKSSRRAEVYVRLAQIREAQSRTREAILNLRKALSMDPKHPKALQCLADLIHAEGDFAEAAKIRVELLPIAHDDVSRFAIHLALADDYEQAKNRTETLSSLEAARAIRPDHPVLLSRLAAIYDQVSDFNSVVDIKVTLAELKNQSEEVAKSLVAAADFALEKAQNPNRAVEVYERALSVDPAVPRAFDSIVDILASQNQFEKLDQCMLSQANRLAAIGSSAAQAEVYRSLSVLRKEHLSDPKGAISALDLCVSLLPRDVEARSALSDLLADAGELDSAIASLEIAARYAPGRPDTYRKLYQLFSKTSQVDRAFSASAVLVHLADADIDEQLFFDQYKPEGPIRPSRPIDDSSWALLYPPSHDASVRAILHAVAPAAIEYKLNLLRQNSLLPKLDPAARQDPQTSTVSLTRTFVWASQVLGVPLPEIYVADSVSGGIAAVPADNPTALVGKSVLCGKSLGQLAFLVARDLTFYRPEHYILILFSTLSELTSLFLAALHLVRPELAVPESSHVEVSRLKSALSAKLSEEQLQCLRSAVDQFDNAGGRVDLVAWARSIEISATRAGLLICGDLDVVSCLLRNDDRQVDDLNSDDRMNDLIAFSVSDAYFRLRQRLGISVG